MPWKLPCPALWVIAALAMSAVALPSEGRGDGAELDWTKVPPIRPPARAWAFTILPSDAGYYSLLDLICGDCKEMAPKLPYGLLGLSTTPSFEIDFRYLDRPDNHQHDYLDCLKRIHCDDWLLSLGGQFRYRTMHEVDYRLTTYQNDFSLFRTRLHADLWHRDCFRLFAEGQYCENFHEDLPPGASDINRGDFLNLFTDVKLCQLDGGPAFVRAGRQEMCYGSRRLISSRDWGNSRRSFDGVKTFYVGKKWDLDAFWMQPIILDGDDFDLPDSRQNLYGLWANREIRKGTEWDFYWFGLADQHHDAAGRGGVLGTFDIQTLGARTHGDYEDWLWDVETMFQVGRWSNQHKLAASIAAGLGRYFEQLPGKPQLWGYYDWASGSATPEQGETNQTFYHMYPAAHYYFGALDLVGRQNIRDANVQLIFNPQNWMTCIVQFHHFRLDSPRDALYSNAGVPLRRDPTGQAGRDVGNELDLMWAMQLATHSNLLVGWSKLFSGRFIAQTGPDVSPESFYLQYNYRW